MVPVLELDSKKVGLIRVKRRLMMCSEAAFARLGRPIMPPVFVLRKGRKIPCRSQGFFALFPCARGHRRRSRRRQPCLERQLSAKEHIMSKQTATRKRAIAITKTYLKTNSFDIMDCGNAPGVDYVAREGSEIVFIVIRHFIQFEFLVSASH
jgi:hypothetical protein